MSTPENNAPPRTQAEKRKGRGPGWIWAVPIAAVGIVAWLLVREFAGGGIDVTVTVPEAPGVQAENTKVTYHGVPIGQVSGVDLAKDGSHVTLHLSIDKARKGTLTAGTRFYLEGAAVDFADPATLKSIIAGPTVVIQPGPGKPQRDFAGIIGSPPPALAVALPYRAVFTGDAGNLKTGAKVTLRGFTVGDVDDVRLTIDPQSGAVATDAVLLLDPTKFGLAQKPAGGDWSPLLNRTLETLVQHGFRAELKQTPPLIGAQEIALAETANAPAADLNTAGRMPEIPTTGGGGIESVVQQAGGLPIKQIGDNVQAISAHIAALAASPQLQDTIDHLDRTVAELDKTVQQAGPRVAPTLDSVHRTVDALRKTATQIDGTAAAVKNMTGGAPTSSNGNLQQTLDELTRAGRSIRTLADYLDQHPEALIKGRTP